MEKQDARCTLQATILQMFARKLESILQSVISAMYLKTPIVSNMSILSTQYRMTNDFINECKEE